MTAIRDDVPEELALKLASQKGPRLRVGSCLNLFGHLGPGTPSPFAVTRAKPELLVFATLTIYRQLDPDHYVLAARVPSGPTGKTSLLVPSLMAVLRCGNRKTERAGPHPCARTSAPTKPNPGG